MQCYQRAFDCVLGSLVFSIGLVSISGEGHSNPLQYSCLENPMDRRALQAAVHRVAQSQIWLKWLIMHMSLSYPSSVLPLLTHNELVTPQWVFKSQMQIEWNQVWYSRAETLFRIKELRRESFALKIPSLQREESKRILKGKRQTHHQGPGKGWKLLGADGGSWGMGSLRHFFSQDINALCLADYKSSHLGWRS